MARRLRGRRGQSILEYLVIITVVVIAIFSIKEGVQGNMNDLYNKAKEKTAGAETALGNLKTEQNETP